MNFPTDTNELRAELGTVAERMAALKRELLRRHREQQKAQTAILVAELDALFVEPPLLTVRGEQRRSGHGRRMLNTGGVPWNKGYNRRILEPNGFVGRRSLKERRSPHAPVKPRDL